MERPELISDNATRAALRAHAADKIGDNIRRLRKEAGMTQAQASELLTGAHESYFRSIENGQKNISLIRAIEIADLLGVTLSEIVEGI